MLMWYGCPEQGRYVFSQLLIDQRCQGRGLGMVDVAPHGIQQDQKAVRLIILLQCRQQGKHVLILGGLGPVGGLLVALRPPEQPDQPGGIRAPDAEHRGDGGGRGQRDLRRGGGADGAPPEIVEKAASVSITGRKIV